MFGQPPALSIGFGDRFFFVFGPPPGAANSAATAQATEVTPKSTTVNAQGQQVATFDQADIPAGATAVTIRQAAASTSTNDSGAAGDVVAVAPLNSAAGSAALAAVANVPNGNTVANDAVSGTDTTTANVANAGLTTSTVSDSSDTNGYLLPIALIGGVVVAAGAVTVVRRRNAS